MPVTVKVDLSPMDRMLNATEQAKLEIIERIAEDSNKHCPVRSGMMRDTMQKSPTGFTWGVPYAVYAYNADSVSTAINPNATPRPFETAMGEKLPEWERFAGETMLKHLG